MTRIDLLLGRTPGVGSVLPPVVGHLEDAGASVRIHHAATFAAGDCAGTDLLVLRGLGPGALRTAMVLEALGTRCANPARATALARNKAAAAARLRRAGVPVPPAVVAERWPDVARWADGLPVAVKAVTGSRGTGVLLADAGALPRTAPFPGPWLVETRIAGDGRDRKLYVIDDHVAGVVRRWPPVTLADKLGAPLPFAADLAALARSAAAALGLTLCGVDVVAGPDGPTVVDVNAFPGFKGVPEAAPMIAAHLLDAARPERAAAPVKEVVACAS